MGKSVSKVVILDHGTVSSANHTVPSRTVSHRRLGHMYSLPCWPLTYVQVSKTHGGERGRKLKAESKECVHMATI